MDAIETANIPGQPIDEIKRLLQFVVVGGGPTGVEFAAELSDFIHKDLKRWYPNLSKYFSVTLVQSADHILNTFDEKISIYTAQKFSRSNIEVLCNHRVNEVTPKEIVALDRKTKEIKHIPYGVCVWSTGLKQRSLIAKAKAKLEDQKHKIALITDPFMRVKGAKNVYAIGDCSEIEVPLLHGRMRELFEESDLNGDGSLSKEEFDQMIRRISHAYPQLQFYSQKISQFFDEVDTNKDGILSIDEFEAGLIKADNTLKSLPSTAQVASQQGDYIAQSLNKIIRGAEPEPFTYVHRGFFAKVGATDAVADIPFMGGPLSGLMPWYMWSAVYLSKQYSLRNKVYIAFDWIKIKLFGRDVSRF